MAAGEGTGVGVEPHEGERRGDRERRARDEREAKIRHSESLGAATRPQRGKVKRQCAEGDAHTEGHLLDRAGQRARRTHLGGRHVDVRERVERAESRILIEQARLLTLKAAATMDKYGNKAARAEIAMIKVAAPAMACKVIDWAIQVFGGAGVTDDYGLGYAYATARFLRLADGPDEVHRNQIARLEMKRYQGAASSTGGSATVLPADGVPEMRRTPVWIA